MTYTEAMEHVGAGRAVFSPTMCGTVVLMPRDKVVMFVPRVTNRRAISPMVPFTITLAAGVADDWVLGGVEGRAQ